MKAVLKRELHSYFHGMTGYIFCFLLLIIVGLYTYFNNINNLLVNFEISLGMSSYLFLMLAIPVLTMRIIAEEKKQGTDKLLYSLPLSSFEIVIAKFIAMVIVYLLPIIVIAFYPLILAKFGAVPVITCYSTLFAFFLLGTSMLAIGMFISSLVENQIIAAILTFFIIAVNYFLSAYASGISGTPKTSFWVLSFMIIAFMLLVYFMTKHIVLSIIISVTLETILIIIYFISSILLENFIFNLVLSISVFKRLNTYVNDLFDITGLIFYLSLTFLFLFFTIQSFEKRRWN